MLLTPDHCNIHSHELLKLCKRSPCEVGQTRELVLRIVRVYGDIGCASVYVLALSKERGVLRGGGTFNQNTSQLTVSDRRLDPFFHCVQRSTYLRRCLELPQAVRGDSTIPQESIQNPSEAYQTIHCKLNEYIRGNLKVAIPVLSQNLRNNSSLGTNFELFHKSFETSRDILVVSKWVHCKIVST